MQTGSYMVEYYLDDFIHKKEKRRKTQLRQLLAGDISPIAYYKDLVDIGEGDLACRMGISRKKLRVHMTPRGFSRITISQLERYAVIFDIPVAHFFQLIFCEDTAIKIRNQASPIPSLIISRIINTG